MSPPSFSIVHLRADQNLLYRSPIHLRDHCRCPECFHPVTHQRLLDTFSVRSFLLLPFSTHRPEPYTLFGCTDSPRYSPDLHVSYSRRLEHRLYGLHLSPSPSLVSNRTRAHLVSFVSLFLQGPVQPLIPPSTLPTSSKTSLLQPTHPLSSLQSSSSQPTRLPSPPG